MSVSLGIVVDSWLKNNIIKRKSLYFVSCQKVKNEGNLSSFFSLKNIGLGAHILLLTFFDNCNI